MLIKRILNITTYVLTFAALLSALAASILAAVCAIRNGNMLVMLLAASLVLLCSVYHILVTANSLINGRQAKNNLINIGWDAVRELVFLLIPLLIWQQVHIPSYFGTFELVVIEFIISFVVFPKIREWHQHVQEY